VGGHASRDGACCGDAFLLVISRTLCRLLCSKPIFSPSYIAARHRFREAAVAARARIHAYEIGESAPTGEPLSLEVATLGAREPAHVLLLTSGLHGVEGFFGSAVQLAWLSLVAAGEIVLPPRVPVVLAHALNPYGFAWRRRVNEHNVDLNRNFLDEKENEAYAGTPSRYMSVHGLLNPKRFASGFGSRLLFASRVRWAVKRLGLAVFRTAVAAGQYEYPRDLFFGGFKASSSNVFVKDQFDFWTGKAEGVLHLDLHTGLGEYASYQLLVEVANKPHLTWYQKHFDPQNVVSVSDDGLYAARGVMGNWLGRNAAATNYHFACVKFGTYSAIRVLHALRSENHTHHYSNIGSLEYTRSKSGLLECFCPRSELWRTNAMARAIELLRKALTAVQQVGDNSG